MNLEPKHLRWLGGLLLIASLALTIPGRAAVDPFTQAALQDAAGRFKSDDGKIAVHIKPKDAGLTGTLVFNGQNFTLSAELKGDRVEGTFVSGGKAISFNAESDGRKMTFRSDTASYELLRQPFRFANGIWESERVWLRLEPKGNAYEGLLKFRGQAFPVTASMVADELLGTGKMGEQAFDFIVTDDAEEKGQLRFQNGAFRDTIKFKPRRGELTVRVEAGVDFTLYVNDQKSGTGHGPTYFDLPCEQPLNLRVQTDGYKPVKTNRTLAAYDADAWEVSLEKSKSYVNSLGMKFVEVPGTDVLFSIWDVRVQDYQIYTKEYSGVVKSGQPASYGTWSVNVQPLHPVVNVNWNDAKAFCEWLSRKEGKTYRLPTDAEWSVAVGLNESSSDTPQDKDEKIKDVYPWGTTWPPPNYVGNYSDLKGVVISGFSDGYRETSPVGSFAANQFGLYDMGGNVWQFCEDWYNDEQKERVARGASWDNSTGLLSSSRLNIEPDNRYYGAGFRCVLEK